jgi:membrane-associated phospholipid phosphatase
MHLRPGRPLLAAPARIWAGALLACCATLIVVLGSLFAHQAQPDRLDRAIDSPIVAWFGGHRGLGLWLVFPGSLLPAGVATAAIVAACMLAGRLNGAVLAAAALPAAEGLNEGLIKPLVHRTYLGVLTYPSGHTAAVSALAATVTVLLLAPHRRGQPAALRILISVAGGLLACVVAIALIGLQFHYFTDTVAGAALGIGTVCGLALLLDLAVVRRCLARCMGPAVHGRRPAAR